MPRATTTIPFSTLKFIDDIPKLHEVESRLQKHLRVLRKRTVTDQAGEDQAAESKVPGWYDGLNDADRGKLKRRAMRFLERLHSSTGTYHLSEESSAKLTPLRGGLPVRRLGTEHEADEIAAALHAEMPWMAAATEVVWHGLRASVREDLAGIRFDPLILVGPSGIGKIFRARRVADILAVPATKIEATGEPATFSLVGSQRGWGSAAPGKLMQTVLRACHAGPIVIVDEVDKVGDVSSTRGARLALTDALLPLLERMTAAAWECPFFQIRCDMS